MTYEDFKSDDNSLDVNYEDLNFCITHQLLKRNHEFKRRMLQRIINVKLNRMNNKTERDAVIVIVIHTFLWHWFRLDSWRTLCYLYWVNKTLWERKSLVVYMTASRSRNNEIDTVLSSNESIASIQRVMLK